MESRTIGVGVVGASPDRGWARAAHVPALGALPSFAIRAVSTTRRETAERSARSVGDGILAFDRYDELIARPEVELFVVAVNVARHFEIVSAALAANKMVYAEWPLGRNAREAEALVRLANERRLRTVIGLQGRAAPVVRYVRDLVADGRVGRILGTRIVSACSDDLWVGRLAPEYESSADPDSGNTLLAIPLGHALDMLAFVLGDFASVTATTAAARAQAIRLRDGARIPFPMHDQIAVSGALASGAIASIYYQGGTTVEPSFVWEIHGTEGCLSLAGEGYGNIAPLTLRSRRIGGEIEALSVPKSYLRSSPAVPPMVANVAALYAQLASDVAAGETTAPSFDVALARHRLLEAIASASATGTRRTIA